MREEPHRRCVFYLRAMWMVHRGRMRLVDWLVYEVGDATPHSVSVYCMSHHYFCHPVCERLFILMFYEKL